MKKVTYLGLALGLVAVTAATAFASEILGAGGVNNPRGNIGGNGIVGSSHDLSGVTGSNDGGDVQKRICVFCHHPHNTVKAADIGYSPLWNRNIGVGVGGASGVFTPYNNSAAIGQKGVVSSMMGNASSTQHMMNGTPQFGGVSLLCMSCHDGATAMNAYSNANTLGATGIGNYTAQDSGSHGMSGKITSTAALAAGVGDMSNHHPVGMNWDDVESGQVGKGDSEIAKRTYRFIALTDDLTKVKDGTNRTGKLIGDVLSQGRMECVTCHDVHNSGNAPGAERFLWVSDDNSRFCLSCHLK